MVTKMKTYRGIKLRNYGGLTWWAYGHDTDRNGNIRDAWAGQSYAAAKRWVDQFLGAR